jgi:hypothetical protein
MTAEIIVTSYRTCLYYSLTESLLNLGMPFIFIFHGNLIRIVLYLSSLFVEGIIVKLY